MNKCDGKEKSAENKETTVNLAKETVTNFYIF